MREDELDGFACLLEFVGHARVALGGQRGNDLMPPLQDQLCAAD